MFSNLINNAIESIGNNKGTIEIQIRKNQRNVFIDIKDSGSGIKQLHMKKIFESLYTTKHIGTGLGLASCKTIVKLHEGNIIVKNNPTTFTIELPLINRASLQNNILEALDVLSFERIANTDKLILEFIHTVKNKEHCILLFHNENVRDKIVYEFFNSRFNQNSACACFTHNVSKYKCDKTISYDELIDNGALSINRVNTFLMQVFDESNQCGFPRIACEDTTWFSEKGYFEEHQKIGNNLDKKIINDSTILCCYDISKMNLEQITTVLKSRDYIILENPFSAYQKKQPYKNNHNLLRNQLCVG